MPILWAFFAASSALSVRAVEIAEFMADNATGLTDADGDHVDWMEIANPDAAAVNLSGWTLTDDAGEPAKWIFPPVTLPSSGRMVVFASGKNRRDPAFPLHANFALDKDGGYLALRDAGGAVRSEFSAYPPQLENVSYGLRGAVLVTLGSHCRWKVPHADIPGWTAAGSSDSLWTEATAGVGYDLRFTGRLYDAWIGKGSSTLKGEMYVEDDASIRFSSACVRFAFDIPDPAILTRLTLRMRYDDGFAAWLNGIPAAAANAPAEIHYNSTALASRDATAWDTFDLSNRLANLMVGKNVLAVQVMNRVLNSNDLLALPELTVEYAVGSSPVGFFNHPTPGMANGPVCEGVVLAPTASTGRGFYDAPLQVSLATATPGAFIRYTLDGAEPGADNGQAYSGPLTISNTTVLRARAWRAGYAASKVMTTTYVFPAGVVNQPAAPPGFPLTWGKQSSGGYLINGTSVPADYEMDPAITQDPAYAPLMDASLRALPVVSITTAPGDVLSPDGLYGDLRQPLGDGPEIPASVEIFGLPGVAQAQLDAGLQMHGGNAKREHPKKPFRLCFRSDYGEPRLRYPLFSEPGPESFDALVLRPGGHDAWSVPFGNQPEMLAAHATYLRDPFVRLAESAMGLTTTRGRYVHLYLNGLYWGLYDITERPAAAFYSGRLGGEEEEWDVVHHAENRSFESATVDGNGSAWRAVIAMTDNDPTDAAVAEMGRVLDLDAFCDHLIVRMWSGDYDWMSPVMRGGLNVGSFRNTNWYAAARTRGNAPLPFRLMSWDAEMCMGLHLMSRITPAGDPLPAQRVEDFDLTFIDKYSFVEEGQTFTVQTPGGLYAWLRQNAAFRRRFGDRVQRAFFNNGPLTTAAALTRLAGLRNTLDLPIVAESARWGNVNGIDFTRDEHWRPEVDWLRDSFIGGAPGRTARVLAQFASQGLYPQTTPSVQFAPPGGFVAPGSTVTLSGEGVIYYTLDGTDPLDAPSSENITLVTADAPVELLVPTVANGGSILGDSWRGISPPANAPAWRTGRMGVGYETVEFAATFTPQPGVYAPFIRTSVPEMYRAGTSLFLRIPFNIAPGSLAGINGLSLYARFDDGFVAWINGQRVASRHAALTEPAWDSGAVDPLTGEVAGWTSTEDPWFRSPWRVDAASGTGALVEGANILCVQVLNNYADSRDLLFEASLVGHRTSAGGSPSASARVYTGPIPITGPVHLSACILGAEWSSIRSERYSTAIPATSQNLVISEFSYRPTGPGNTGESAVAGGSSDFEFIEVRNAGPVPADMAGIRFTQGISFVFPAVVLSPQETAVVVRNRPAFAARYGAAVAARIAGEFAGTDNLNNGGERITLVAADGEVIRSFSYDDAPPWPMAADGGGFSLELVNPIPSTDHSLASNWRSSADPHGSPGDVPLGFAEWMARWKVAGTMSDGDGDGMPALMEFALGTNPFVADAQMPPAGIIPEIRILQGQRFLTARFRKPAPRAGLKLQWEFSPDLLQWTALHEDASFDEMGEEGIWSVAKAPIPVGANRQAWLRLRAALTP